MKKLRTFHTRVVGLNMGLFDFAVFYKKSVALAAITSKDGLAVKGEVKSVCE